MIKYYLIPVDGDGLTAQTAFRPKYVGDLKLNYSLTDLRPELDLFLVSVNTKDSTKLDSLESNSDVIDLTSNTKAIRTAVKKIGNIDITAGGSVFEKIIRTKFADFTKDKSSVESD